MNIEDIPITQLKHFDGNPREMNDEEMSQLISNLQKFGFVDPLVIDEENTVLGGNQRLKAATKMGLKTAPCFRKTGLSINEKRALVISLNKISGRWIEEDLEALIKLINESNPELGAFTGLNSEEINNIINTTTENNNDPEIIPEKPPSICKTGDIWILGNHRLLCGDCTKQENIERLMNGKKAELTFTSPPYNLGNKSSLRSNKKIIDKKNLYETYDDNVTQNEWLQLMNNFTELALAHSEYVFCNVQMLANNKVALVDYLENFKESLCDIAIWDKGFGVPAMSNNVMNSAFEFIIILSNGSNKKLISIAPEFRGTIPNVFHIGISHNREFAHIHGALFPIELPNEFLTKFCKEKKIVLDPFGGLGTTIISAELNNRYCYMMELDEHYCDIIIKRWEDYTGRTAIKEIV